jgi:probable rRNA maturation factor
MDKSDFPRADREDPERPCFIVVHDDGHRFDCMSDAPEWYTILTPEFKRQMMLILGDALRREATGEVEISLLFTSDDAIAKLNKTYRNKSGSTDVLSFPADDDDFLGDIALAYGIMAQQASVMNITLADHALHLILHGTLHLCGHDHQDDEDATVMEELEIEILGHHGIINPYHGGGSIS